MNTKAEIAQAEVIAEDSESPASLGSASAILTGATLLASAANYALNLLLARWMTPQEFGDASLIVTIMLGLTAVAISVQLVAAQRTSSAATSHEVVTARSRLTRQSWIGGLGLAAAVAATSPLLAAVTSSASAVPFVLLALGLPFYLVQSVERGVLQGRMRFLDLSATLVVEAVTRLGIGVLLVVAGWGVIGATAGITASFVASWWWGRRAVRTELDVVDATSLNATSLSSGVGIGQATTILLVGQIFINNGDVVLAKTLFSSGDAGVYSVVALIGRAIFFLSGSVVTAAFPHVAQGGSARAISRVRRQTVCTVTAMCVAMTLGVALCAPMLAPIVFGEDYRSAGPLFAPYAIATSLFAIANVYASLAVANGRCRPAMAVVGGAIVQTAVLLVAAQTPTQMVWLQVAAMAATCVGVVLVDQADRGRGR